MVAHKLDKGKQSMFRSSLYSVVGLALIAGAPVSAQILPEIEPNDSKANALANGPYTLSDGMGISGFSTGGVATPGLTSADYFLLQNTARPLGIYRHRMILDSQTPGFLATLRGLNQIAAPAGPWTGVVGTPGTTDTSIQSSFIAAGGTSRMNQWYGFGRQEQVYYRVAGTTSSTGEYTAVLHTEPVIPMNLGVFQQGQITISTLNQGHTSDTDFWVYDGNLNPIRGYGNDDNSVVGGGTGTGLQGHLIREYAPGTYYLALSLWQMALNEPSPSDDNYRTGTLMDFPNIIASSSTGANANVTFAFTDSTGTSQFPATRVGQFDVVWAQFTVVPAPGSLALLAVGGLVAIRRRRA
jgi:hypothetical protein